jgi:hypothetical protein
VVVMCVLLVAPGLWAIDERSLSTCSTVRYRRQGVLKLG